MVMSANAAAIVREGARRGAKEFHPRCSLCPSLSSSLPFLLLRTEERPLFAASARRRFTRPCFADLTSASLASSKATGRTDDEKAAGTKKEGDSPSRSLAFAPSID